jgi:hypothetical protein
MFPNRYHLGELGHQTEAITQAYLNSFDNSVIDDYDELIMK